MALVTCAKLNALDTAPSVKLAVSGYEMDMTKETGLSWEITIETRNYEKC